MTKERKRRAGTAGAARRKHRPRPVPKWLGRQELDQVARSRCLMVLSVLSGEKPVSDAIAQVKISRGTYYQMETRALKAMMTALNPLATVSKSGSPDLSAATARIEELQARVARLEQEKRRTQRLLHLTRKTIWGRVTTGRRGRPPKNASLVSIPSGKSRSAASKEKLTFTLGSIPTKDGGAGAP